MAKQVLDLMDSHDFQRPSRYPPTVPWTVNCGMPLVT